MYHKEHCYQLTSITMLCYHQVKDASQFERFKNAERGGGGAKTAEE